MTSRRGFTLIELMTAVAIIGALTALASLAMAEMQKQARISGEVRRAVAKIQQMRAAAVSTGDCHGILFAGPGFPANPSGVVLENHIITFRKLGPGCADFDPANDVMLSYDWQGGEGISGDGDRRRATNFRWAFSDTSGVQMDNDTLGTGINVTFDPVTARPTVTKWASGPLPMAGRGFLQFRDRLEHPMPVVAPPATRVRRLELSLSGSTMVSQRDY